MINKNAKGGWSFCWVLSTVILFFLFGFVSGVFDYSEEERGFCILRLSCNGDDSMDKMDNFSWNEELVVRQTQGTYLNLSGYNYREEGMVEW